MLAKVNFLLNSNMVVLSYIKSYTVIQLVHKKKHKGKTNYRLVNILSNYCKVNKKTNQLYQ